MFAPLEIVNPELIVVMESRAEGTVNGVGCRGEGERPYTMVGETMATLVFLDAANTSWDYLSIAGKFDIDEGKGTY